MSFTKQSLAACAMTLHCLAPSVAAEPLSGEERVELVDLVVLEPSILLDVRYATPNNFTGQAVYRVAKCYLRREAAERLVRVQRDLQEEGLGLKVFDCYRPFSVQQRFWEIMPDERYVAKPVAGDGRPLEGSKHNRGAAVDLTLVDAAGNALEMPSDYDDFSERAHRDYAHSSAAARANMRRLEEAMVRRGFEPLPTEWWHFDLIGWEDHALLDIPLEPGESSGKGGQ